MKLRNQAVVYAYTQCTSLNVLLLSFDAISYKAKASIFFVDSYT